MEKRQPTKSSLNKWLWIIAVVVVVAAATTKYIAFTSEQKYLKAKEKLEKRPEMPIEITYRQAIMGPGLVVSFKNSSNRHLSVVATFRNPTLNQEQNYRLDLAPDIVKEVGHQEGWAFASGDTIKVSHNDYKLLFMVLP